MPELPQVGEEFAGYQLRAVLGRGGMSVVYEAENPRLGNVIALKVLSPELANDDIFRARFLEESRIAAAMNHPHVIPIHDTGSSNGLLYIAMRCVSGTDLRQMISKRGRIRTDTALFLLSQAARALDAAHRRGLVHRDVKPGNLLIERGADDSDPDHLYLTDFGITKPSLGRTGQTSTGHFFGTVDYVAPEQIRGLSVLGLADQYSLGCVLYECLTGQVPFEKDLNEAIIWAHVEEQPAPPTMLRPDLPPGIDDVLTRVLAKEPADRYENCRELIAAARAVLGPLAAAPSAVLPAGPPADRRESAEHQVPADLEEPADDQEPVDYLEPVDQRESAGYREPVDYWEVAHDPGTGLRERSGSSARPDLPPVERPPAPPIPFPFPYPLPLPLPGDGDSAGGRAPAYPGAEYEDEPLYREPTPARPDDPGDHAAFGAPSGYGASSGYGGPSRFGTISSFGGPGAIGAPSGYRGASGYGGPGDLGGPGGGRPPGPPGRDHDLRVPLLILAAAILIAAGAGIGTAIGLSHGGTPAAAAAPATSPSAMASPSPSASTSPSPSGAPTTASLPASALVTALKPVQNFTGRLSLAACKEPSSTFVTCTSPDPEGAIASATFQTFPSLSALYTAYQAEVASMAGKPFAKVENTEDCGSPAPQPMGEISWNHSDQHTTKYSVAQIASGKIPYDVVAGRMFCTQLQGGGENIVWTQNFGNLLVVAHGAVSHEQVWLWFVAVHHNVAFGGQPAMPGMSMTSAAAASPAKTMPKAKAAKAKPMATKGRSKGK